MDIVRISNSKLKLTLDDGDMEKYGIKKETLSSDTTTRRRALWTLLDEAKRKTGIDAAGKRTLLEAFPGRCGGCEIFVTLLSERKEKHTVLYRFFDLEHLRSAAEKLNVLCAEKKKSALYRAADGSYHLALCLPEGENRQTPSPYSFLDEYGSLEKNGLSLAYIREYGTCVYPLDAITRLVTEKDNFSV